MVFNIEFWNMEKYLLSGSAILMIMMARLSLMVSNINSKKQKICMEIRY